MTKEEFSHIANKMREKAISVARSLGYGQDDAEDIAQDVMIKLWCMHETLNDVSHLKACAMITTKHICIDKWRTSLVHTESVDTSVVVDADSLYDKLEYSELEQWLNEMIESLPSTTQTVLTMRQLEHRSLDEIADILGIKKTSVSTLLSGARNEL
jgi:RNA polymerase sigma-70 factor (ECF subfamily)